MNTTVQTALEELLTEEYLPRVVDTPVEPFGYGTDLWCDRELDPSRDVDGAQLLAQALARRLDCPRGQLVDDPDYGMDLRAELNRGRTTTEVNALASRIQLELTKDDRVDLVRVTVTPSPTGSSMTVAIRVTPFDAAIGGFSMTLAASDAGVVLEQIARAA